MMFPRGIGSVAGTATEELVLDYTMLPRDPTVATHASVLVSNM
jgi:hypothetical protein